ncbi:DUF6801 domain-containing protein [Flexivirga meconopsidis]|uniref:DUF6801 domain-containing protein n=1 Tax=Flexivirga meconopsidis TaxID=2977121 RepID=UPI00223EDAF7|nr:DUF6801 domain-containing protein [Flexivirga meconopsidis]
MTQQNPVKKQISRRTLAKGAAWSVPVVATAVAAPAATASPGPVQTYSAPIQMACKATAPLALDLGTWDATISTQLPSSAAPGDQLNSPPISADVTVPGSATSAMSLVGAKNILSGTADSTYSVSGAVVNGGSRTASLTVQNTPIAVTGGQPVNTTASGVGQGETAGPGTGSATVQVTGPIEIALVTDSATSPNVAVTCTLAAPVTLASIPIN